MKIGELFTKPINRPINGVIKADQKDAESVWQELDEYVVTKQLTEYFRRFFDAYLASADNPNDPVLAARMGVWVSGFFGSGKSHFIKILSYLLENLEATNPATGEKKRAAAFFDEHKIKDSMLLADIQRAVRGSADVVLFNIDAKADSKDERDVILQVFLRVFNEKLGFSADAPHIAHMERYLVEKGSVTVDGISLTVAGLSADRFELMIIPFTMAHTNLRHAAAGTPVNLEFDVVGKYVARAAEVARAQAEQSSRQ